MTLTVFLPAYNEEATIAAVLNQVLEHFGDREDVEILVVNDGSSDRTGDIVRGFPRVRLIEHPYNRGYGSAIKTGIRNARGRVMVIFDADGQHNPAEADRLVQLVDKFDLVVGKRGSDSATSAFRGVGITVLSRLASYLAEHEVPDLTSGFRAFKVAQMRQFEGLLPKRFSFSATSTMCYLVSGYSVCFEPIVVAERQGGKSSIRPFRDASRFIGMMFRMVMLFNPNRFFLPLAAVLLLAGLGWGAYKTMVVHQGLSVFASLLCMAGLQVALIGIVADQLSQLRRQVGAALYADE